MGVSKKRNKVLVSDKELRLLEAISQIGPCSSEKVHESLDPKVELLFVMRSLHNLVEKGFLQRIVINNKQLYRTARNYTYIKSYINASDLK